MEEHESYDSMDVLDDVGDNQVSHNAESRTVDTESESNSSSTCCSSSSSIKTVSVLDHLHMPTPLTLARKRKIHVNSAPPKGRDERWERQASRQAFKAAYVPRGITGVLLIVFFYGKRKNNYTNNRES